MRNPSALQRLRVTSLLLAASSWIAVLTVLPMSGGVAQPVLRTQDLWKQVYQLIPDLPLENQYVNKETREASSSTLISRLIRYHVNNKGRSPIYRLDWKLTLADYLGANERISASVYPGADIFKTNPLEGDVAAIQQLTRVQRDALVQALVTTFAPAAQTSPENSPATPTVTPSDTPGTPSAAPSSAPPHTPRREPRPGDANLLLTP
jgi:hypothetical protein